MNRLTKALLGMLAGVFFFGVASIGLTWSVSYKPYGVPDHLRQRYDQTIAELEQQQKQARAPGAKPRVRVAKTLHDFGMMDPHATAKYAFEVANIGESPLELHVTDSSCKCTIGKLLQPYVAPGETTQVTLTWNTGYQADEYQQTVLLSTNDPNRKTIELSVKGTVRSELVVPGAIAFAKSDLMKETSSEFYVYSQLWDEFVVT
ncbi:MAG: DUF1573 domain-containing protein, partial [Pirellulaceae bacterium]|nr:DUF1573 domain-containing protein [Pirellulaceae bacterium]